MDSFSVTFVVGATNESRALKTTVDRVLSVCSPQDISKILIVKSKQASKACNDTISELERTYPGVVFGLEQTRPYIGGAIQDGFDSANSSHLLLLPGDLAVDLNSVPLLIEKEKQCPDGIVKVSRWLAQNSFHDYPPFRRFMNACAQIFLRILYHTDLTDLTNPVQILPTALHRRIDWKEFNFPFLIELVLCPLRLGTHFSEVPTSCYGRTEGKSNSSFFQTALYLKTALRIRFTKPENLLKTQERSASAPCRKSKR